MKSCRPNPYFAVVVALVLLCATTTMASKFSNLSHVEKLSSVNTNFGVDLYKFLASKNSGNVFFSPLSISTCLAMVYTGAEGQTCAEMASILHFDDISSKTLNSGFRDLQLYLNAERPDVVLRMANKLYGNENYKFLAGFLSQMRDTYQSDLQQVNFGGDPEGVRGVINKWVEGCTADKIRDLIPQGVLNSLTALVLVNAIYFKADWQQKFDSADTRTEVFHVSKDEQVQVEMMHAHKTFPVGTSSSLDCQVLQLPYKDQDLSMYVLLPNKRGGISQLESKLDGNVLNEVITNLRPQKTMVSFPRFKIEESVDLHDVLKSMGIKDLFDETRADLSGMDGTRELYVSKIFHKAFVEVNEEGSEAAAATAAVVMMRCIVRPVLFEANHPFLFMIHENTSGAILFLGRVTKPDISS